MRTENSRAEGEWSHSSSENERGRCLLHKISLLSSKEKTKQRIEATLHVRKLQRKRQEVMHRRKVPPLSNQTGTCEPLESNSKKRNAAIAHALTQRSLEEKVWGTRAHRMKNALHIKGKRGKHLHMCMINSGLLTRRESQKKKKKEKKADVALTGNAADVDYSFNNTFPACRETHTKRIIWMDTPL